MATAVQWIANKANAQLSTGPVSEEGKAVSSRNATRHGFAGRFTLLDNENPFEFDELLQGLLDEHKPESLTETMLLERLAQHYWLSQRAIRYQAECFTPGEGDLQDDKQLALFLRYQSTHDREFNKCLTQLLKIRADKRKAEIGFVLQKQKEAEEVSRQELHEAYLRNLNARSEDMEMETEIRTHLEAPLPGNITIPFDTMRTVIGRSLGDLAREMAAEKAA